ncbi:aminotransferase class V-fold PLP-dependent enzyme [Paraflavisolibacter sp. H34]|uniref:aminotransferase class V-fold PLP-dependent enzyme n=1 Tax=Huijunlia imazamoxiresistens TaxID=3127457 RepID=UPI00301AE04F
MFPRRSFLQKAGSFSLAALFGPWLQPAWSRDLQRALQQAADTPPASLASDEDFWRYVQQAYTVSAALVNLNNAGMAPAPKVVQEAMKRYHDLSNEAPSYFMTRVLDLGREPLRRNLAALAGVGAEEIALQRNATEALETVIFGLPLQKGDEVVLARQDYPSMINAWKQREQRDGIRLVWVNLQLPSEDNDYLAKAYTSAFTARTKVVQVTHLVNWNGQVLPVKRIADAAHARGIEVLVDGAQSFAHLKFAVPDTGADYFGASLHKWLSAPIGTGLLYVKKEKIGRLYPLFASIAQGETDIRKFEHLGTRPFFIEQAVGKAVDFHDMIGGQRKEERLLYLKNYWMERVAGFSKVRLGTSLKPGFGCAIGLVSVDGKAPRELEAFLMDHYKVHTVAIDQETIKGVRVSPNVYTTTKELDVLVEGIRHGARTV